MKDDNKPHNEIIIDQPGMTSVITREYIVIPGTDAVIHKRAFGYIAVFVFAGTSALWAIGLWTTVYQQLAEILWNFQWNPNHWGLWLTEAGVVGVFVLYAYLKHKKKLTAKELSRREDLRTRFP